MAKNMPKIAEVKLSTCGLEAADFRKNCYCEIVVAEQRSFKKLRNCDCEIASVKLQNYDCRLQKKNCACSETTLTGESRLHTSPSRGFELGSLVTGNKQVVHWTSETWWEWIEIPGSPQGFPPAANSIGCEAGREPAASVKQGQKSCVRSSEIITLSAWGPSHSSVWSPPQTRPQKWSITLGSLM
jgi:hypothetical protein